MSVDRPRARAKSMRGAATPVSSIGTARRALNWPCLQAHFGRDRGGMHFGIGRHMSRSRRERHPRRLERAME